MSSTTQLLPKELKKLWNQIEATNEYSGKNKLLIDYAESLLIYLSGYIIGEYRTLNDKVISYEKFFYKNNKNLSTGTYQYFLREGLKILKKADADLEIDQILHGKNDLDPVSKFIVVFECLKKHINEGNEGNYSEVVNTILASRNNNFGKTNALSFFDNFIQLRNRTAHPHKEIKGKNIHWPASQEYYSVVNDYLYDALNALNDSLTKLWSYKKGSLLIQEDKQEIIEEGTEEILIELKASSLHTVNGPVLLKDAENWVYCSIKENTKVGQEILDIIEQEKAEAQKVANISELKTQIELALDDGQISNEEYKFFKSLGVNKLSIQEADLKNLILEVAESMQIEDPFPEVDNRLIQAIDDALLNNQFNSFFMKLLGANYGVEKEDLDKLIEERATINGIDLNELGNSDFIKISTKSYRNNVNFIMAASWLKCMGILKQRGIKNLYDVEKGNNYIPHTKEYYHDKSFEDILNFTKEIIEEKEAQFAYKYKWNLEVNNWQQGNMGSYAWVKVYPETKHLSSHLGLGFSVAWNYIACGFLPDYRRIETYDSYVYPVLRDLYISKLKEYAFKLEDEFINRSDLWIMHVVGLWKNSEFSEVITDIPNYLDHFSNFEEIRFWLKHEEIDNQIDRVTDIIELSYSLFGALIEDVYEEYGYLHSNFSSALKVHQNELLAVCKEFVDGLKLYTEFEAELIDDYQRGKLSAIYKETVKGQPIRFEFGFREDMNAKIQFFVQMKTTRFQEERVHHYQRYIIKTIADRLKLPEDHCIYDAIFSIQIPLDNSSAGIESEKIEACKQFFDQFLNVLIEVVSEVRYISFFDIKPNLSSLTTNIESMNQILEALDAEQEFGNKIQQIRSNEFGNYHIHRVVSTKKYGTHQLEYGFYAEEQQLYLYTAFSIANHVRGAELMLQMNDTLKDYQVSDTRKIMTASNWQVNTALDSQFTSTKPYNDKSSARYARLNSKPDTKANWCSKKLDENQWIQLDMLESKKVTALKLQGRYNRQQWVEAFKVSYSLDGENWQFLEEEFEGNKDMIKIVTIYFDQAFECRFIRIHPTKWHKHISLRFDVLAEGPLTYRKTYYKQTPISSSEINEQSKLIESLNLNIKGLKEKLVSIVNL